MKQHKPDIYEDRDDDCAVCAAHGTRQCPVHGHNVPVRITYEGHRAIVHGVMLLWCMCCEQYTSTSTEGCIRCLRVAGGGPSACGGVYRLFHPEKMCGPIMGLCDASANR